MKKHRYGRVFFRFAVIRYGWSFILLKMLKQSTAGVLFFFNAKRRHGWDFDLLKMVK